MAAKCVLTSWNVRGLGDRVKRLAVGHVLKRLGSSVVCLQETHMLPGQDSPFSSRLYGNQYHSAFSSYARGVSTLIGINVPFALTSSTTDPGGRFVFLHCTLHGIQCIIANIYIPPPFSGEVLKTLATFLSRHPGVPALVVGDFNNFLCASLDKFSPGARAVTPRGSQTPFARLLQELGLSDVCRLSHPQERCYSCHSASNKSLSRIDLGLGNSEMLPWSRP